MPDDLMTPPDFADVFRFAGAAPEFTLRDVDGRPLCTPHLGGHVNAGTIDRAAYTVEAITSTNMLDRWGEIIEPSGWSQKNYRLNPIVLLEHDPAQPIGASLGEEVRPRGLWQKIQYAAEATPLARDVWALVMAGVYRAFSPGWLPLKWETFDGKNKGEGWPPGRQRDGIRFTKVEQLELSQVAIPATPNAVLLSMSKAALGLARKFGQQTPESALQGDLGVMAQAAALMAGDESLAAIFQNALQFQDTGKLGAEAEAAAQVVADAAELAARVDAEAAGTAWWNSTAAAVLVEQATCQLMLAGAEIRALR